MIHQRTTWSMKSDRPAEGSENSVFNFQEFWVALSSKEWLSVRRYGCPHWRGRIVTLYLKQRLRLSESVSLSLHNAIDNCIGRMHYGLLARVKNCINYTYLSHLHLYWDMIIPFELWLTAETKNGMEKGRWVGTLCSTTAVVEYQHNCSTAQYRRQTAWWRWLQQPGM